MDHPLQDKNIDGIQTLINLSINSNAAIHVMLDLLTEIKAKLDNKTVEEVSAEIDKLLKERHESTFELIKTNNS